jgi:RNase P subunit RPR2
VTPTYCAAVSCPDCRRTPNVSFSADEVRRARRERQAAHVVYVQCLRCGTGYWIQARDIAKAKPEPKAKKKGGKRNAASAGTR